MPPPDFRHFRHASAMAMPLSADAPDAVRASFRRFASAAYSLILRQHIRLFSMIAIFDYARPFRC